MILHQQAGDVILVGHSYGGAVITEAATHKKVAGLVYITNKMIPLPAQQFMCERTGVTSAQVPGSHAIYVSNPAAVAALIKTAATSPKLTN